MDYYCSRLVHCCSIIQDMCVSDVCNVGFYRDVLTPNLASIIGDLELGSDVCVPCEELCARCAGPGSRLEFNSCQACRFATQGSVCVQECNNNNAGLRQKKSSAEYDSTLYTIWMAGYIPSWFNDPQKAKWMYTFEMYIISIV